MDKLTPLINLCKKHEFKSNSKFHHKKSCSISGTKGLLQNIKRDPEINQGKGRLGISNNTKQEDLNHSVNSHKSGFGSHHIRTNSEKIKPTQIVTKNKSSLKKRQKSVSSSFDKKKEERRSNKHASYSINTDKSQPKKFTKSKSNSSMSFKSNQRNGLITSKTKIKTVPYANNKNLPKTRSQGKLASKTIPIVKLPYCFPVSNKDNTIKANEPHTKLVKEVTFELMNKKINTEERQNLPKANSSLEKEESVEKRTNRKIMIVIKKLQNTSTNKMSKVKSRHQNQFNTTQKKVTSDW